MDANLRELGVGDLTVPKRMQKFGEAFYGRAAAYNSALEHGGDERAGAGAVQEYPGREPTSDMRGSSRPMPRPPSQRWPGSTMRAFGNGSWRFPSPALRRRGEAR